MVHQQPGAGGGMSGSRSTRARHIAFVAVLQPKTMENA